MKMLKRKRNAVFAGVLAGLGEYFGVDATVLRVLFIFFVLVTGVFPGVIAYLLAIIVMPLEEGTTVHHAPPSAAR